MQLHSGQCMCGPWCAEWRCCCAALACSQTRSCCCWRQSTSTVRQQQQQQQHLSRDVSVFLSSSDRSSSSRHRTAAEGAAVFLKQQRQGRLVARSTSGRHEVASSAPASLPFGHVAGCAAEQHLLACERNDKQLHVCCVLRAAGLGNSAAVPEHVGTKSKEACSSHQFCCMLLCCCMLQAWATGRLWLSTWAQSQRRPARSTTSRYTSSRRLARCQHQRRRWQG